MKKYVYDESNGLWYELQGDYYMGYGGSATCATSRRNVRPYLLNF